MQRFSAISEFYESNIYLFRYQFFRGMGFLFTFFMPLLFGKFSIDAYTKISEEADMWVWSVWKPHWPVLVFGILWLLGYFMVRYRVKHITRSRQLYNALKWVCTDLCTRQDKSKDIRSTIWIPIGKLSKDHAIHLVQFCDYFPLSSTLPGGKEVRNNGKRFRTFTVTKKNSNRIAKPIGVLGYTAFRCVGGDDVGVMRESFNSNINFIDHMVNDWHFSPARAEKLTKDRKSYLCFPIMNRDKNELLGILYFDSCKTKALDNDFVNRVEYYLPRFGNIITEL